VGARFDLVLPLFPSRRFPKLCFQNPCLVFPLSLSERTLWQAKEWLGVSLMYQRRRTKTINKSYVFSYMYCFSANAGTVFDLALSERLKIHSRKCTYIFQLVFFDWPKIHVSRLATECVTDTSALSVGSTVFTAQNCQ
jgi:hypothetical protein